jgi:hypothetical protein
VENETKEERKRRMLDEAKVALETRSNAKVTGEDDDTHGLWIAGEKWVREKRDLIQEEGLTLVLSTGTGFAKEVCTISTYVADNLVLDASDQTTCFHVDIEPRHIRRL